TISGGRSPEGVLVMDFRQTQMLTPMISGMLRARGPGLLQSAALKAAVKCKAAGRFGSANRLMF
ncbi:MAG: hypothetical protein OTI35_19525, partial [Sulfitobacter sp.]|nr:hypothetical protein [Sulfitobacter sp.]